MNLTSFLAFSAHCSYTFWYFLLVSSWYYVCHGLCRTQYFEFSGPYLLYHPFWSWKFVECRSSSACNIFAHYSYIFHVFSVAYILSPSSLQCPSLCTCAIPFTFRLRFLLRWHFSTSTKQRHMIQRKRVQCLSYKVCVQMYIQYIDRIYMCISHKVCDWSWIDKMP